MVQRLPRLSFDPSEHRQDKRLDVLDRVRIARELGKVPANVRLGIRNLFHQQVVFVQEQDYRHVAEHPVVDYRVEYVFGLFEPVRFPVLEQHLVEFGGGHEEEDGGHRVEALEPLLPLRPLAANVHKEEWHFVYRDRELGDALCGFAAVQNVLVRWDIVWTRYPFQVGKEIFYRITLQTKLFCTSS